MERKMHTRFLKLLYQCLFFCFVVMFTSMAMATSVPNTSSNPRTFLGPSASLSVTKSMSEDSAFSLAGEGGPKIIRLDGTLGWELSYYQRIKATAEFLRENLTYSFFDGRQSAWMNQGAFGVDYQYDFHETVPYNTKLDLAAYVSHAPSRNLGTSSGVYNNQGAPTNYTVVHRVAGSNAAGVSPGVIVTPWEGTSVGLQVNYDSVRYNTINRSSANAKGLGGTVFLNQNIVDDVDLGLSGAVRAPYNDYEANISWGNIPCYSGLWKFKIYGAYTIGKNSLPTTYDIGIGADFLADAFEQVQTTPPPQPMPHYKDMRYKDMKPIYKDQGIVPPVEWEETEATNKDLLKWTSIPAVRIPTVLTVTDGKLNMNLICVAPTLLAAILNQGLIVGPPYSFNVAPNFSGTSLTFALNFPVGCTNGGPVNCNVCASISGSTVTVTNVCDDITMSITASNQCGSVTSNTFTAFT